MGVPKFYRWISERYTKINEIVTDSALLPEFDHLYLDMNGIIHGCTHPSHLDVSDVISERDMMLGIMHYLDRIITQIVKPKVSVFMAIDGVAPRAKLNQQRSRRFRSAKDMAEATKDMKKEIGKDGVAKKPVVFDSNCITPGTEFMARVSETIKYFIRKKIKEDPSWRNLKVIFSGQEIPGEGEHKLMEHIRMMRNQPGYQPNTRHCIYGQDADLIMLALVTHEPSFTILREVVDFTGGFFNKNALKQVKKFTKESDFQLLHLSVLREYLAIEFCKDYPKADLERSIDDFVFLTFLVGNDFLPHLTTLDIGEGAFDLLFSVYKEQRPGWGDGNYLTNSGDVSDPARLEAFLAVIGAQESETLENRQVEDAKFLEKKRKWNKRDGLAEGPTNAELEEAEAEKQRGYEEMMQKMMSSNQVAAFVDGWAPAEEGKKDFKGRYYYEKLHFTPLDIEAHHALRKSYIEGLMWCLAYYYRGCISWGWFYPYHYGPMLSDLRSLPEMFKQIKFEVGAPIKPFQQLMSCLPPASSALVPKQYRELMTKADSPIAHFYPRNFQVDMNGKKNPWEGVNLLPFIEIELLKSTIAKFCPEEALTAIEKKRNSRGIIYGYHFDMTCTETIPSPNKSIGLTDITKCNSHCDVIPEYDPTGISFKPELVPGTRIPYPGFPSLNVLPIADTELTPISVDVFGMKSKYPTTVLKLHQMPEIPPVETLADAILDKPLFINWPMMHEARVVAITDSKSEIRLVKGKKKVRKHSKVDQERWSNASESIRKGYLTGRSVPGSGGVDIGEISVRLKLLPLQGMKTNSANGATKKLFGKEEADVPLQLALWQSPAPDPRFIEKGTLQLSDRFPAGSNVVLTKGKYRGCVGNVVGVAADKKVGVKVFTLPPEMPFGLAVARSVVESHISSGEAARVLKLHPSLLGKITGSIIVQPGNYDLGLNLKSSDGMCVAGFSRQRKEASSNKQASKKTWDSGDALLVIGSARSAAGSADKEWEDRARIQWEYTPKAIRLVNQYRQEFPMLFAALVRKPNEKKYDAKAVFGPNGVEWLPKVRSWLNGVESAKLPRTPISTETLSRDAVVAVEKAAEVRNLAVKKKGFPQEALVKTPGSALYRENSTGPTDVMQASDHNNNDSPVLGDRIVNLCGSGIPFGARGTVVGVHQANTGCVEVVMDEEFVGGTNLQGLCSNFRGKLVVWAHVMKVAVDNSEGIVEKMVPRVPEQVLAKKAIAEISKEVNAQNSSQTSVFSNASLGRTRGSTTPTNARAPSAGKARSGSAARGRSYKEARGPPEKGYGFNASKKNGGRSGLQRWKEHANSHTRKASARNDGASAGLKAMLGVTSPPPQPKPATEDLKAMLGVGAPPTPRQSEDATSGLKALLGVGNPASTPFDNFGFPPPPPPPPPQEAITAADRVFQMMASQSQQPQQRAPVPGFNFTYVEEGKESQAPQQQFVSAMGFPPPPPPPMHATPYGIMPVGAVPMFPGGMVNPQMSHPLPVPPPPPQPAPVAVSDDEFPALGAEPKPKAAPPAVVQSPTPNKASPSLLVPTSVQKRK